MLRLSLRQVSFTFFMLLSCFSYVSFSLNSMDTQIWHFLLIPICFVFFRSKRSWQFVTPELLLSLVAFLFLFFSGFGFIEFRSLGSYWSLLFTIIVTVFALSFNLGHRFYYIFCSVSVIYFLGGLAQLLFGKYIFDLLVHVRTTPDRGVTSFAAEPSYFATITLILSWLVLIYSDYRPTVFGKIAIILNVISIFLLAQSAIGICYVVVGVTILGFSRFSVRRMLIFGVGISSFLLLLGLSDGRSEDLFFLLFKIGIYDIFMSDASINIRIANAFLPIYISFDNFFFPFFYGAYSLVSLDYESQFQEIFWYKAFGGERIMSFFGAFIFELGIIGLLYFLSFIIRSYYSCNRPLVKTKEIIFLFSFLISAVPIAMPLVGILIGTIMTLNKEKFYYSE